MLSPAAGPRTAGSWQMYDCMVHPKNAGNVFAMTAQMVWLPVGALLALLAFSHDGEQDCLPHCGELQLRARRGRAG